MRPEQSHCERHRSALLMRAQLRAVTQRRRRESLSDGRKRRCMDLPAIWSTVKSVAPTSVGHPHRSIATYTCHSGERRNPASARMNRTDVIASDLLRTRWLEDKFKAGLMS